MLEACRSLLVRENESSEKKEEASIGSPHTSRHLAKDADWGFRLVVQHHARADTRVQKDHKGCSKGRDEKVHLGPVRLLLGHVRAKASDEIQHQERSQSQGGINGRRRQPLERVDDDQIRRGSRIHALNTHKLRDLARDDVDGRARHERADGWQGNELDEPA